MSCLRYRYREMRGLGVPFGLSQTRAPKEALGRGVGRVGECCISGVLFQRSFGKRRKGRGRGGVGRELRRRRKSWFISALLII